MDRHRTLQHYQTKLLIRGKKHKHQRNPKTPPPTTYIKLHGSYGWVNPDNTNTMVIGGEGDEKEDAINSIPILKYYINDIFKKLVFKGDMTAVIIGYGFGDTHINMILLEGIEKYKLKIIIISPQSLEELDRNLENSRVPDIGPARAILKEKGLIGYINVDLKYLLNASQGESIHLQQLGALLTQI